MLDFLGLLDSSNIQLGYFIVYAVMYLLYRVFLALAVYMDGSERDLDKKSVWAALSFFFGIIIAVIYAIANSKKENVIYEKSRKVFAWLTVICFFISINSNFLFQLSFTGEFEHILNPEVDFSRSCYIPVKNEKGKYVIYDKQGNEYKYSEKDKFLYYDRQGNTYRRSDELITSVVSQNDGNVVVYESGEYNLFIDQDGYICVFDNIDSLSHNSQYSVYYDNEGNFYYDIFYVGWDSEGNLIFFDGETPENLTYEMVIKPTE